ncbi:MAG: hypothetical protein ABEJ24_04080 [Candidatus Magasanikbacteria bacterium]
MNEKPDNYFKKRALFEERLEELMEENDMSILDLLSTVKKEIDKKEGVDEKRLSGLLEQASERFDDDDYLEAMNLYFIILNVGQENLKGREELQDNILERIRESAENLLGQKEE